MNDKGQGSIRVCEVDNEPVISTLEFAGAEYYCVVCKAKYDVLYSRYAPATDELVARFDQLLDRYTRDRAERIGKPIPPKPPQDIPKPVCCTCGVVAKGQLDHAGKPHHWYSKMEDRKAMYACSQECIPKDEKKLPW